MWYCSTYGRSTSFFQNRHGNDNLEQQAQALFKSWFVDFEPFRGGEFVDSELGLIPKGWRVVSLGEVTKQITERSEEHTSELQSRQYLVCRLLLEKNFF